MTTMQRHLTPINASIEEAPGALDGRRREVYRALLVLGDHLGFPPSLRQLGEATDLSVSSVHGIISLLERRGWLTKSGPVRRRALVPLRSLDGRPLPRRAAQRRLTKEDGTNDPGSLVLPACIVGSGPALLVEIDGSEVGAIHAGDHIVVGLVPNRDAPAFVVRRLGRVVAVAELDVRATDQVIGTLDAVIRSMGAAAVVPDIADAR